MQELILTDSVTRLDATANGNVVIGASHCGLYAAYLVARAGVRGVILSDAGIGREMAGIAGLDYLAHQGIAAAVVSHRSARIGDVADCAERGMISGLNDLAVICKVELGMSLRKAAQLLSEHAEPSSVAVPAEKEVRQPIGDLSDGCHFMDSVSLLVPSDVGAIVATGSHGGCLGGRPETAAKVDVYAALYNDADVGIDNAGISRLPPLDARGIAAGTVSAWSARIGDGLSTYRDGYITHLNRTAFQRGARIGQSARQFVETMKEAREKQG